MKIIKATPMSKLASTTQAAITCSWAVILFCVLTPITNAQEWTRFRGPNGSGVSSATTIPTTWTDDDLNWKVELPSVGHSSPVIWGEKLFVSCAGEKGAERILQCRSTKTGELIWEEKFKSHKHKTHKFNSFASSTPCVDERAVYTSWGTPEELVVIAVSHAGKILWEARDLGSVAGGHGFGTSPILFDGMVIIANDTQKKSSLIALDCKTGQRRWETPRPGGRLNFSTPCIFSSTEAGDQAVFVAWPIGVTAVNAHTGKMAWEQPCFDKGKGQRAVGSPIVHDDLVFATSAFVSNPKHLVVLKPSAASAEEVFRVDNSTVPHIPSLIVYEDRLFAWADKGIACCYDAKTGKRIWQKRVGGNFFSSPICVNGILYCIDVDGICVVVRAGDEYEELARIDLGEATRATPAVANGTMFIRTFSHLLSIGGTEPSSGK